MACRHCVHDDHSVWLPAFRDNRGGGVRLDFQTAKAYASAISRRAAPEPCVALSSSEARGRREDRVRAAPAVPCALLLGKMHTSIQVSGGIPAFPARWFTAYSALSRVTGLSCHPHPRQVLPAANLTPASGRQDHTSSPSATAALVIRRRRVHRIPPHVRDDREPPLSSGETGLDIR